MTHTRKLLEFLRSIEADRLPRDVISAAQNCVLDTLGCALFGSPEAWSRIMADEMLAEGSKGDSTIVGRRVGSSQPPPGGSHGGRRTSRPGDL